MANMQKSQSLLEYATIIAVVAAALMAMHVYVQRATQSNLRLVEDKLTARQTVTLNYTLGTSPGGQNPPGTETTPSIPPGATVVTLDKRIRRLQNTYGYHYGSYPVWDKQYYMVQGETVYFTVDQIPGKNYTWADIGVANYNQTLSNMEFTIFKYDRATNQLVQTIGPTWIAGYDESYFTTMYPLKDYYYVIKLTELGQQGAYMSVWWKGI